MIKYLDNTGTVRLAELAKADIAGLTSELSAAVKSAATTVGGVAVTAIPNIYLCNSEADAATASAADTASLFIVKGSS